jgi:acyl carrier protein
MASLIHDNAEKAAAVSSEENVFVMPCSAAQVRFWQIDELSGETSAVFNIQIALRLTGTLREDILQKSINALVDRHEILRTSFRKVEGELKQVIYPEASARLNILDLQDVPEAQRPARMEQEIQMEADRPLPLSEKPIFRPMLLRLAPQDNVLLMTVHHIVCDGWASGILVRELGLFYEAFAEGKSANLTALPLQYADYALWQKEWAKTEEHERQLAYWREQLLKDLPVLDFPTDFPRQSGQAFPSTIETLLLPMELSEAVKRLSHEWETTPFVILFATYILLLHRYTGQSRFILGTTAANRTRVELEGVVGVFANPMILRADLSGRPTVRQLLDTTREMILGSFDHQEVPFETLFQELETQGGAHRKPTIQAFFLFQKAFLKPAEFAGLTMRPIRSVTPGTTFEQTLAIIERGEGMRLQIDYNTALFKQETMQRFLMGFQILLEGIVHNPDSSVADLPLLTKEERNSLQDACEAAVRTDAKAVSTSAGDALAELNRLLDRHVMKKGLSSQAEADSKMTGKYLVLDERLRAVPPGVPGRIFVMGLEPEGGDAKKYVWVTGPADMGKGIPLLQTDYLGRGHAEGKIELWGKTSDFVSFRGFRVNLREIEGQLLHHPRVADALAVKDEASGKLVCYVVPKNSGANDDLEMRAFLKEKMSELIPLGPILFVSSILRDSDGKPFPEQLQAPKTHASIDSESADPDTILYQQLAEIWKDILKIPDISLDDNFFDLGGSSFQAIRMMAQIEKVFGENLPLSLLLKGATLSNLARVISSKRQEDGSAIQVVQSKGTAAPLFFLHGDWAGGGFYCNRIARVIGEDRPFYAISPYRNSGNTVVSMDEMAAYHVASIKEIIPQGPYVLGGYCIGATLAIEIARQLMAGGDSVTHLFLVDPSLGRVTWLRHAWTITDQVGRALGWNLKKRMRFHDRYPVALDRWLKLPWSEKNKALRHRFSKEEENKEETSAAPIIDILNTVDYGVYALANRLSVLRPLSVPATFYYPLPLEKAMAHAKLSRLDCTQVGIEELPGNHVTCITKYSKVLGNKLKAKLSTLK